MEWKAAYAPRAAVMYRVWLERFDRFVSKTLCDVKVEDIIRFQDWVSRNYKEYTVTFAMVAIKNFFKFWALQGEKVVSQELIKVPRSAAQSYAPISLKEYHQCLSVLNPRTYCGLRDIIIIRFLWDTGMRVSELCDLDVTDIDPEKNFAVIQTKKNRRKREVLWGADTHYLLKDYLKERKRIDSSRPLFVGYRGRDHAVTGRLTTRSVQRMVKKVADYASIKKSISPHSFRHGWAHYRRDQGAPLAFVQKGLGHKNPQSTFIYEQYTSPEFRKEAKKYHALQRR